MARVIETNIVRRSFASASSHSSSVMARLRIEYDPPTKLYTFPYARNDYLKDGIYSFARPTLKQEDQGRPSLSRHAPMKQEGPPCMWQPLSNQHHPGVPSPGKFRRAELIAA